MRRRGRGGGGVRGGGSGWGGGGGGGGSLAAAVGQPSGDVKAAVRRATSHPGENRDDRAGDLRCGGRDVRPGGGAGPGTAPRARPGRNTGVHGQDAILVFGRPREARRPERVHAPGARHPPVRGRGVRGRARGRHHDDARVVQVARGGKDPRAPGRDDRGTVLMAPKVVSAVMTDHAPKAIGPYSQAMVSDGTVFTAGQIALDPKTGAIVGTSTAEQAEQVLNNLDAILKAAGSSLALVVKTTVYLLDMADFRSEERRVGKECRSRWSPYH